MSIATYDKAKRFVCKCNNEEVLTGYHFSNPIYLDTDITEVLFDAIYPVALSAFCQTDSDRIRKDVFKHAMTSEHLAIVLDANNECVAFRIWDFIQLNIPDDILYLAGMCVHRDYQRQGVGAGLLEYVFKSERYRQMHSVDQICALPKCKYIALRTQNPIMKQCFDRAIGGESFPCADERKIPSSVVQAAERVAICLGDKGFNSMTLTSSGVYEGALYGHSYGLDQKMPENNIFKEIDPTRGDAVYCLWQRT